VNGESVVFTFSPHPAKVLAPEKELVLLTTFEEKIELFKQAADKSALIEFKEWDKGFHELHNDKCRDELAKEIINWISK